MLKQEDSLVVVESWNSQEQLNDLLAIHRNKEIVEGVVRSIVSQQYRTNDTDDGKSKVARGEILIIALPNGTTGYCAAEQFMIRDFNNYRQFVGRKAKFYIENILLEENKLILNGKRAQEDSIEQFWSEIKSYQEEGSLAEHTFKGIITGVQAEYRGVFVNIEGQDTFMNRNEWSYNVRDVMQVQEGEEVEVRIVQANVEERRVFVSRKATLPDPYKLLQRLSVGDLIAGKVTKVDHKDGIFVQLENGLDVKASKLRQLETPIVGDMVSCRISKEIEREGNGRIRGRVIIIGYPNGKRKRRDLGSFLFE